MPIFRRNARTGTAAMLQRKGVKLDPETRRMMDLADRLEAALPEGDLEFGNAWLAAFARHGHDNSNTAFAFTPAAVKGPFYNSVLHDWRVEQTGGALTAAEYIERRWIEIERTCYGSRMEPPLSQS